MMEIGAISERRNLNDWIKDEARRCLDCYDPPCRGACPASIPVPEFIRSIRSVNLSRASRLVRQANAMAAICGEVCPEEVFCQSACTRGKIDHPISIKELHSFATRNEKIIISAAESYPARVAVIGAGPAGLACAATLAERGIKTAIFEKSNKIGGVPSGSIPKFRLSDESIAKDMMYIQGHCPEIELGMEIEKPESLLGRFDAVFVSAGLDKIRALGIPGENLEGVTGALSFLESTRNEQAASLDGKRVVVIGGGNVSLDAASAAAYLGASEVRLTYRRGPREMRAWKAELAEAEKLGIVIDYQVSPVEFMGLGKLTSVKCQRTLLTDNLDPDGRRKPVPVEGSEFVIPADLAIIAVGIVSGFRRDIKVNPDLSTSVPGIFAGGDWARGEGTIVEAVRDGKLAAQKIAAYLKDGGK